MFSPSGFFKPFILQQPNQPQNLLGGWVSSNYECLKMIDIAVPSLLCREIDLDLWSTSYQAIHSIDLYSLMS